MARNIPLMVMVAVAVFLGFSFMMSFGGSSTGTTSKSWEDFPSTGIKAASEIDLGAVPGSILKGDSIAPKLENATAKAELGRASWKLFHTMMARFPEEPTEDDSLALKTYIHLFGRLYPCGDCARHFRGLLEQYPPQTSSRNAAAGWACFVHNLVNERLEKEIFDCNAIGDFYDCGCGEEGKDKKESLELESP